jgi:hypothetical protein
MNRIVLFCVAAALLATAACGGSVSTNSKPAATPASAATPAAATSPAAATEGKQDFTLINKTGVEIHKVLISPHDVNEWGEDILGQDTLADGQSVDIKFHRSEKAAMWDLRVEDQKGTGIEWESLNLLEISKVTLYYENGKARAVVE